MTHPKKAVSLEKGGKWAGKTGQKGGNGGKQGKSKKRKGIESKKFRFEKSSDSKNINVNTCVRYMSLKCIVSFNE